MTRLPPHSSLTNSIAYVIVRTTMGLVLLAYGVAKFLDGRDAVVARMVHQFADSPIPDLCVRLLAQLLPFLEVVLGVLLVAGVFTLEALIALGALLIALTVGKAVLQDTDTVAHNLIFVAIVHGMLVRVREDRWGIDWLWRQRT